MYVARAAAVLYFCVEFAALEWRDLEFFSVGRRLLFEAMLFGALFFALLKEEIAFSVVETKLAFGRGFGARFAVDVRRVVVAAVVNVLFFVAGAIHGEGKQRELSGRGAGVLVDRCG